MNAYGNGPQWRCLCGVGISDTNRCPRCGFDNDPDGAFEGRTNLREVTREEWEAYRQADPRGDWNISTPVGVDGPERYFISAMRFEHQLIGDMLMNRPALGCRVKDA